MAYSDDISTKANRVLNVILLAFVLILMRVWYLGVIQKEHHLQEARRPQRRTTIERADRATIRDRFNIPLATNKIQYNVAISYGQIRQIPTVIWTKDDNGKKIKQQARIEHIAKLAAILSEELDLDPEYVEDLIHCRASIFPHVPYVIKSDISEQQYYKFRMMEKDWMGLQAEKVTKRIYPQGKTAADVIGYMGSISSNEYHKIAHELKELEQYLKQRESGETPILPRGFSSPMQVRERFFELNEKAYTMNDFIGKTGIEAAFDEQLRGFYGKKYYEVDVKGNILRELPGGRSVVPGQRVLLSISSELQAFAESLLAEYEMPAGARENTPWIKGGAIVAMLPKTGEVVALASSPRINPNDFIESNEQALLNRKHWIENDAYLAEIWDGKIPLEKEYFSFQKKHFLSATESLTWDNYLKTVIGKNSAINLLSKRWLSDLDSCLRLQRAIRVLCHAGGCDSVPILIDTLFEGNGSVASSFKTSEEQKEILRNTLNQSPDSHLAQRFLKEALQEIKHNNDKLLLLDLSRLLIREEDAEGSILSYIGKQSASEYRSYCQLFSRIQVHLQKKVRQVYHQNEFREWRSTSFKEYLKQKRAEEKQKRSYPKPYLDYLDEKEKKGFREFWEENRIVLLESFFTGKPLEKVSSSYRIAIQELFDELEKKEGDLLGFCKNLKPLREDQVKAYLQTFRSFDQLKIPLWGKYRFLRVKKEGQTLQDLAAGFYPKNGYGYGKSQAYRQSTPQGSVFKLVTAYQALLERYLFLKEQNKSLRDLNPLTLVDELKGSKRSSSSHQMLGYTLDGHPIQRMYKGGMLPRSHPNIGKIDLAGALENSSNIYFSILAAEHIQDPGSLVEASRLFGFGGQTGIDLPGEISGNLPDDVHYNRTGLYSFAIGQHSLVVTPLQCAVMVSAIANQGYVLKPKIIQIVAGKEPKYEDSPLYAWSDYPFKGALAQIGIHFPLFTEALEKKEKTYLAYSRSEIRRNVFLPNEIRSILLDGMYQAVNGAKGTARPSLFRNEEYEGVGIVQDYRALSKEIVGKTGTAQILHKQAIDEETRADMMDHVWFAAISLPDSHNNLTEAQPELVVVVYLRFGRSGKQAAPLAAQVIKKWREICEKYGVDSSAGYKVSSKLQNQIHEHFDDYKR